MDREKRNILTIALFAIYLVVLVWTVLFKLQFPLVDLRGERVISLIPLKGSGSMGEIYINIFVFIPFGLYIGMLRSKWPFISKVLLILGTSLAFELLQYIFAIGRTDITDLLGNTLGGTFGILVYLFLSRVFKEKTAKIMNIVLAFATILALSLIAVLLSGVWIRFKM